MKGCDFPFALPSFGGRRTEDGELFNFIIPGEHTAPGVGQEQFDRFNKKVGFLVAAGSGGPRRARCCGTVS
jgi:hypothetical protein